LELAASTGISPMEFWGDPKDPINTGWSFPDFEIYLRGQRRRIRQRNMDLALYTSYVIAPYVGKGKEITALDLIPRWVKIDIEEEEERLSPKKKEIEIEKVESDKIAVPNENKFQKFRRLVLEEEERKFEAELVEHFIPKFE
jgi:hypothetical protein